MLRLTPRWRGDSSTTYKVGDTTLKLRPRRRFVQYNPRMLGKLHPRDSRALGRRGRYPTLECGGSTGK